MSVKARQGSLEALQVYVLILEQFALNFTQVLRALIKNNFDFHIVEQVSKDLLRASALEDVAIRKEEDLVRESRHGGQVVGADDDGSPVLD